MKHYLFLIIIIIASAAPASRAAEIYDKARLGAFYELTASDPLFYSSAINEGKLEKAIAKLEREDEKFKNLSLRHHLYYQKNGKMDPQTYGPDDTYSAYALYFNNYDELLENPEKTFLHPLEFLKTLPEIKKQTDLFLKNKNGKSAAKLLELYEKAATSYKKSASEQLADLEQLLASVDNFLPGRGLFTSVTPQLTAEDFRLITANAGELEREIAGRKGCLLIGKCDIKKSPPDWPEISAKLTLQNPIPEDLLVKTDKELIEKLGPYAVKTDCFGADKKPAFYILIRRPAGWNEPVFTPKLADENFYRDLSLAPLQIDRKVSEKLKYQFLYESDSLSCPDLRYWADLSQAATGNKFMYLPEMINAITDDVIGLRQRMTLSYPIHLDALIAHDSAYSLTYFTFSKAFWRLDEQPKIFESAPLMFNYATYGDLKKEYNDKEIKKFHFRLSPARTAAYAESGGGSFFGQIYSKIIHAMPLETIKNLPVKIPDVTYEETAAL